MTNFYISTNDDENAALLNSECPSDIISETQNKMVQSLTDSYIIRIRAAILFRNTSCH
jgi:hypothetical protein